MSDLDVSTFLSAWIDAERDDAFNVRELDAVAAAYEDDATLVMLPDGDLARDRDATVPPPPRYVRSSRR